MRGAFNKRIESSRRWVGRRHGGDGWVGRRHGGDGDGCGRGRHGGDGNIPPAY